jgi:hypothetical protein
MPNGKPGDYPLTDILIHKLTVFGKDADDLIRKIADLSSSSELNSWWQSEIGSSPDRELIMSKGRLRLAELQQRANQSGWETQR